MTRELTSLRKYEAYKDSGVEWIGQIPVDWSVCPGKRFHRVVKELNLDGKCKSILSLTLRGVVDNDPDNPEGLIPRDYGTYQIFEKDDLVFKLIDLENIRTSRVGLVNKRGIMSPAYIRLRVGKDCHPKFAYYFYYNLYVNAVFNNLGAGVRSTIGPSDLVEFPVLNPSYVEQVAICNFLDVKIDKIARAIALKQRQIELLKEHKQILTKNAVISGLNPHVPMRDSGVDWIDKIPKHWKTLRFKNLFTQSRLPVRPDDGVVTSYRDGQVTLRSKRRLSGYTEALLEQGYQGVRRGQLVLNSMDAFEGAIGISDSDGKCTPEYVVCDPISDQCVPEYFALLLREMALAKYIQVICNAVRQRAVRIRFNNLAARYLVVPPQSEQLHIVQYIKRESKKISNSVALFEKQISKLEEYRRTLIDSAVTGKIKVSQLAGMGY
ncbi:restriction endonuclease subunit S [Microbulbifer yueqingensis]|uniref:Type I restriction enzyme, S subunit n=1 Tax=Microbulbifer yueqingensis TaxID=658219 RepID=A0A1G9DFN0_9GAMM|nr:restriction endonuclease subunit S [Microbulbifer yueqingensis]SDK62678.1 type I restriction enzyme, S subunit [Microbulbifer yueqingensis]